MYKVYHLPICSDSRVVRLVLLEKEIKFELISELIWNRRTDFLKINPAGTVPVTIANENIIIGTDILAEYLDEVGIGKKLMGNDSKIRLEIRRIHRWFDKKFSAEVTKNILFERVFKRLEGLGGPSSNCLRAGRMNLLNHLNYMEHILKKKTWLAGEEMTLADLTAAGYLSSMDYLGEISWRNYSFVKEWYAGIKSRPSFRAILKEVIPGMPPSSNYTNLDF